MRSFLIGLALASITAPAFAQTPPNPDDAVAAARNQLGVLEYCETSGHIDGTAVATQNKFLGMMPTPTDTAKIDAAYEKGKAGTVSAMGIEQSLAASATAQGSTEAALCEQLAAMLAQVASQLPQ